MDSFLNCQEVSKGVGPQEFDLWSECCGSTFDGEIYHGHGRCSSCKEMSGSYTVEGGDNDEQ